ncbi:MAG: hypothetical protein HPY50_19585 [Firmicutes bacterium]|nr:hypothetical protein [Bacillota bacterium]
MNRRERVLRAINRQEPDRVPWGEISIPRGLIRRAAGSWSGFGEEPPVKKRFLELLGMDLLVLDADSPSPAREEIRYWGRETDFFVFLLLTGGFTRVMRRMGWKEFFLAVAAEPKKIKAAIAGENRNLLAEAEPLLTEAVDGVIIGDDISARRALVDPGFLRESVFPSLQELVQGIRSLRERPVFFHSDGDLTGMLDEVVEAGFQGLQGMEPSAGMDLAAIKREYGGRLCLMGSLGLEPLLGEEGSGLEAEVARIMDAGAPGGGFIFSTTGGLVEEIDVERLERLSRLVAKYGKYK